ncbi:MAG: YHS domain-containing protein [Ignavibacteria bacterium]
MKVKFLIFVLLIVSFVFNFSVAQEKENQKLKTQDKIELKSATKKDNKLEVKKIWNEVCPVMGDPVDPETPTVEYNGKIIGFCCKSCIKKFKKDPEKYLKNLSEDGKRFIKQ